MVHIRFFLLSAVALSVLSVATAFTPNPNKWYKLKTLFQGPNKCLEGNRLAASSTLGGAAFMDTCQNVSGQSWRFVPIRNRPGYYRMKTRFQGAGKCFEGNRFAPSSTLGGAAFMDNCQNVSGQMWKIKNRGSQYFTLTTLFRESSNECLEGNAFKPTSTLGGAAFMSKCKPFSGQLFEAQLI